MTNKINELVMQGKVEEAYSLLSDQAAQEPDNAQAHFELGSFCYNQGKFAEAERSLRQANSISATASSFYLLGLLLLRAGKHEAAMESFREACELDENFALGHLHWGIALLAMNSLNGALGQFKLACRLNPQLTVAFYEAGVVSYRLGSYVEAAEFFAKATELESNLAEAFNGLGAAQLALQNFSEARQNFEKALSLDETQVQIRLNLAATLMRLAKLEEASRCYQEAINQHNSTIDARSRSYMYNDWGVNLAQLGHIEEAVEKLFQAVDIDPSLAQSRLNLGLVRISLGEYEQAADDFEKLLELEPNYAPALLPQSTVLFLEGRCEEALERLTALQMQGEKTALLSLWKGYCHLALKQFAEAETSFRDSLALEPDNPLSMDGLGAALAFQDQYNEAVAKFKECTEKHPDYAPAHLHLARSYEAAGNIEEALVEYKAAVNKDPDCFLPEKETIESLLKHARFDLVQLKAERLLSALPEDEQGQLALVRALRGQNRQEEAAQALEKLLAQHPNCGVAHMLQGQIYLAGGQLLEADEKFRMAAEFSEPDAGLYFAWAKTLGLLGLHELAIEKLEKANEIDPFDADIYEAWGATLKLLGRYQDAAEIYRKAAEYI
ncbi:MAG: tetratricopeptide repeat protein [Candidatus Obscuribacterales bacterium]|nr:tetratricopeptide repeat protein [Candidatus Obscuribacterales bacterium]